MNVNTKLKGKECKFCFNEQINCISSIILYLIKNEFVKLFFYYYKCYNNDNRNDNFINFIDIRKGSI